MSGIAFEVDTTGIRAAALLVQNLGDAPTEEHMEGIARFIHQSAENRIRSTNTAPDGTKWKSNANNSRLLYSSGALLRSLDYTFSSTEAKVTAGSGLVYARIHQEGGDIRPNTAKALSFKAGGKFVRVSKVTMPARPYIGLSTDEEQHIVKATEDWLMRRLKGT